MGEVIAVAEGPSAAGKTTWCDRHAARFVPEYSATGVEAADTDFQFWVGVNCDRWAQAVALERVLGVAVCDGDPLKLHYSWCLSQIGACPKSRFERELRGVRDAFAEGRLGFADLVMVSIPPPAELRRRRDFDASRGRRSFDLHATLAGPLRQWYEALDGLDVGRVLWTLPDGGLPARPPPARDNGCDLGRLDELVNSLPSQ